VTEAEKIATAANASVRAIEERHAAGLYIPAGVWEREIAAEHARGELARGQAPHG
jgi:hypothetical protein